MVCSCGRQAAHSLVDGGGCNNGAVSSPRRPRPEADVPSVPASDVAPEAAMPAAGVPAAGGVARPGRLTKQVVFFMLIGWLVLVILAVVLISVT
jgi:hypothetical protein